MPMLIGGYSGDKGSGTGISVIDDGKVTTTIPVESPSWIARHPALPVLYSVGETDNGTVHAWSLTEGVPDQSLGSGETGGADPAHLAVDGSGQYLITANYSGASVSVHRLGPDGSIGERTDLVRHERSGEHPRQEEAHPHMVRTAGEDVLIVDLGADAVYRYHLTGDGKLAYDGMVEVPAGSGPRHLLPVGDRFYLTAELSAEVLAYDGDWQLLGVVPASSSQGHNQPSELVSNGQYLYVANRGPDTVSVFALNDGDLPEYRAEVAAGSWPRHIALDGDDLYVAGERSHEVIRMAIDPATGIPAPAGSIPVPSPTVILP